MNYCNQAPAWHQSSRQVRSSRLPAAPVPIRPPTSIYFEDFLTIPAESAGTAGTTDVRFKCQAM